MKEYGNRRVKTEEKTNYCRSGSWQVTIVPVKIRFIYGFFK